MLRCRGRGGWFAGRRGRRGPSEIENAPKPSSEATATPQKTAFEGLPRELLLHIGSYLRRAELASLALVSRALQDIGEDLLYRSIKHSYEDRSELPNHNPLWLLHRTLTDRPELAAVAKTFRVDVSIMELHVEVPVNSVLQRHHPLVSHVLVQVDEVLVASSLIFGVMRNLHDLKIYVKWKSAVEDLFGTIDLNDTNATEALGLQHLESLEYHAPNFPNALVGLPLLRRLYIGSGSTLGLQKPPRNIPNQIEDLTIEESAQVLRSNSLACDMLSKFLGQFNALEKATIKILDDSEDWSEEVYQLGSYSQGSEVYGSFMTLVSMLAHCANQIKELSFSLMHEDDISFLDFCFPVDGLDHFTCLQKLEIPYEGLVMRSHIESRLLEHYWPGLADMLPESLESLTVLCLKREIFECLRPLIDEKGTLPCLKIIRLHCSNRHNDDYPTIAILNQPNNVQDDIQKERSITIEFTYNDFEWDPDWANYDIAALALAEWQFSLRDSGNSDRVNFTRHNTSAPKMAIWEWIGNQERWRSRYQTSLRH